MTHLILAAVLLTAPADSLLETTVEDQSLLYRVTSYDNYHMDRDLLTAAREKDQQLQQLWKNCGQTAADRDAVIAWYASAINGQELPMPELSLSSRNPFARTYSPHVIEVGDSYPTIGEYDRPDYQPATDVCGVELLKCMGRALVIGVAEAHLEEE